jgi:hypothetical protein
MVTRITVLGALIVAAASAIGQEPKQLVDARREFAALKRPSEADRVRYVTRLVRLRETFTRAHADIMFAIDAEVRRHPMPEAAADQKSLTKRLIGRWQSPRRPYFYHSDGTWFSDEDASGNTGGNGASMVRSSFRTTAGRHQRKERPSFCSPTLILCMATRRIIFVAVAHSPGATKPSNQRCSQPLAGALSHFNFMKQLPILAKLALASGG